MSIETSVAIKAIFRDDTAAKGAIKRLKKSLVLNEHDLPCALNDINPLKQQNSYQGENIYVENISQINNIIDILCYTYTSERPIWFVESLYKLGAHKIQISNNWDERGKKYYFRDGKITSKNIYDGDKPKTFISENDRSTINKDLFLPEGRVHVKAKLISHWFVGDIYENDILKFVDENGEIFYYKGSGKLTDIISGDYLNECEFNAAFESGNLDGEYVSFAKRPTKICLNLKPLDTELTRSNLQGTWEVKKTDDKSINENGEYWLFDSNKFYYIWKGELIGPKEFTLSKTIVYFLNDSIQIHFFDGKYIKAKWDRPDYSMKIPECELVKISSKVNTKQDKTVNFTMLR